MRWLCPLVLILLGVWTCQGAEISRDKRFAAQSGGCRMIPENSEAKVVPERTSVTLECTYDTEPESCIFTHNEPMHEGSAAQPDIRCSAGKGETGQNCKDEPRVQYQFSGNKCGISISDTRPEDSGSWRLNAIGLSNTQSVQTVNSEFKLYTYNRSTINMLDEDEKDITNGRYDTSYNKNDRQNWWETGKSNWETVEFTCRSFGGRPTPIFRWYFENKDKDYLNNDDLFKVNDQRLSCDDRYSFICNVQSTIQFTIDDKLMTMLRTKYGVDTNPRDNLVRFDLNCLAEQEGKTYIDKVLVQMQVQKRYDSGALASDTIGIIVGVIIAVIVLVIAIAILVFAKASARWCFADEYDYNDPRDPKKHPRTVGGGGGGGGGHTSGGGGGHSSGGGGGGHKERSGGGGGHHQQQRQSRHH